MSLADLAGARRALTRAPGFTVTVVLTLALGVGATTTLVSALDMLLFRAPPGVVAPDGLVRTYFRHANEQFGEWHNSTVSYPDFTDLSGVSAFSATAAIHRHRASLGRGAEARPAAIAAVTGGFFPLLGTEALAGRLITPADDQRAAPAPVAVLSERLWRTRYGQDPAVIGSTIALDDQAYTVIGVAPAGFDAGEYDMPDLYLPFMADAPHLGEGDDFLTDRGWYFISVLARLAPGATREQAAAEATTRVAAGRSDPRVANGFKAVTFGPVVEAAGPDFTDTRSLALWLAAMSGVVLLIACANVANLLLVRGLARAREMAIRHALGAARLRLFLQLLLEGIGISLLAGLVGMLIASWGGALVRTYLLPEGMAERFGLDGRVFLVALGSSMVAALLAGLVPALRGSRSEITPMLREGSRGSGFRRSRLRAGLVVAQVALSVLLVVGALLFVRSLRRVLAIDIGYDRSHVVMVDADPVRAGFTGTDAGQAFETMADAARAHPGVVSAALTYGEPFGWSMSQQFRVAGRDSLPRMSSGGPYIQRVTGDYFSTMGLSLRQGRAFGDADRREDPTVAVIGATMARRYFPGENPIGQCLMLGSSPAHCTEVIGVASDGIRYSPREEEQALYYVPLPPPSSDTRHLTLFIRTRGDASTLTGELRTRLQTAVPNLPYVRARPLQEVLEPSYRSMRLGATLFGLYAAVALVLAALGLYGVLAYSVRGRSQELSVRLALGAAPESLLMLVVRDGLRLAALGVVLGLTGAVVVGRAIGSLLYDTPPTDPMVLGAALGMVLLTSLLASVVPARRATRLDPMRLLRTD